MTKAVLDALKTILVNDSRVVCGETLSLYAEVGGHARVVIRIRPETGSAAIAAAYLGIDADISQGYGATT